MSDSLFDDGGSSLDEMTFSVLELNTAVKQVLEHAFPHDLWVQGEVQRVSVSRNGHTYFQLVERDDSGDIKGAIDVACWAGERRRIERDARDHGGLTLEADTPVRIRGRVTLYPAGGRFQFMMTDKGIRRFKAQDEYPRLIEMSRANLKAREDNYTAFNHNNKYLERAEMPEQMLEPLLNGNEIMEHTGLKPGPHVGHIRQALLTAQIAGEVNTREEAIALARQHAEGQK